jgi:hypothetical protein
MFSQVELELFGKVLLAGLLGFVVGLERELMGSPAGDRTFSLVALGSALFTALSFDVFGQISGDALGRVAANVLTGVGFLGGGMILKEGGTVHGRRDGPLSARSPRHRADHGGLRGRAFPFDSAPPGRKGRTPERIEPAVFLPEHARATAP